MKGRADWLFFLRSLASFSLNQLVPAGKDLNTSTVLLAFTSMMLQYKEDVIGIINGDL